MSNELNSKYWTQEQETVESIDVKLSELNKAIAKLRWTAYRLETHKMELKKKLGEHNNAIIKT